jgi:hypothetical protein
VLAGGVGQAGQQLAQVAGLLLGGQQQRRGDQVGDRVVELGGEGPQPVGQRVIAATAAAAASVPATLGMVA